MKNDFGNEQGQEMGAFEIHLTGDESGMNSEIIGKAADVVTALIHTLCEITQRMKLNPSSIVKTYLFAMELTEKKERKNGH